MSFKVLLDFIDNHMKMSHIYQPVMLMTLLDQNGSCHQRTIAKALLAHDESQIEYYTQITNNMVGRVLRRHEHVTRDQATKTYHLVGYDDLQNHEVQQLREACQKKLDQFLEARGRAIFDHRRKSSGYISGTIRYEVLKRAKSRCEACGISVQEKAIEVDHIVPRNKGGSDDLSNLQGLCYSCNAMKRDRDDTDFHQIIQSYDDRADDCLFCKPSNDRLIMQNQLAYAIRDAYPATQLHTLVIPKRHVSSYFDLHQPELNAISQLLEKVRKQVLLEDSTVVGFNVGVNDGNAAGQTVDHCHVHLIPRRQGDMDDPRGGVRHAVAGKGNYLAGS